MEAIILLIAFLVIYEVGRRAGRRERPQEARPKFIVPLPAVPARVAVVPMVPLEDANQRIILATHDGYQQGCAAAIQAAFESHTTPRLN